MNIADELRKLRDLHDSGALTDAEFAQAKAAVLKDGAPPDAADPNAFDLGQVFPSQRRVMRITATCLVMAVLGFLCVALTGVLNPNHAPAAKGPAGLPMFTLFAGGMLAVNIPLAIFATRLLTFQ